MPPARLDEGRASVARAWAPAVLLVLAAVVCYANSLRGPFLFDDAAFALDDSVSLRHRPVVRGTLLLNRWISTTDTLGYHLVNLAVHAGAALLVLGIVRHALSVLPRKVASPDAFALLVALLWTVHPLQTESVSYISQRAESLAGLFVLGTLYAFVRSTASAHRSRWYAAALAAFALGMGTKEIAATAPLLVWLYDRTFVAGSFRAALRERRLFYGALFAAGLGLFAWFIAPLLFADSTSGFRVETVSAADYARTQPGVILHYLRLSFWPRGQCLDAMWPIATRARDVLLPALVLAACGAATLIASRRRSWLGFVGAWFFVTLAPSSSFVPIQDLAVEHRMYLPLAAVVVLVVAALWRLGSLVVPRRPLVPFLVGLGVAVVLALATVRRNRVYQNAVDMWNDVVARAPHSWRGHLSLGMSLLDAGAPAEAARALARSIELGPRPNTYLYLGRAHSRMGAHAEALRAFDEAARLRPLHAETLLDRGIAYLQLGDPRALEDLERSAAIEPTPTAFFMLGVAAVNAGDGQAAERHFRRTLELAPGFGDARGGLGRALLLQGRPAEAARELEHALRLEPGDPELEGLLESARATAAAAPAR